MEKAEFKCLTKRHIVAKVVKRTIVELTLTASVAELVVHQVVKGPPRKGCAEKKIFSFKNAVVNNKVTVEDEFSPFKVDAARSSSLPIDISDKKNESWKVYSTSTY